MSGDPHTVPRARSGASRGKVCYRVLAASAVLVCTCSRRTLRVATSRAAAALTRCSIVCRGAHALLCGQVIKGGADVNQTNSVSHLHSHT